jgi:preprotein translocase subunit YajC
MDPTSAPSLLQSPFVPMAVVAGIIYMLLIRPQQAQEKEHQAMLKNLKTGDKVLTTGGLYGTITGFKGDDLEVQFSQTVKLTVQRSAVTRLAEAGAKAPVPAA